MSVVRSSGVTVATLGAVQLGSPAPRTKRKGVRAAAAVQPADGGVVVAEMKRQDLELVDAIPLTPARVKRGASARAAVALDVPLGPDEEAVVLIEEEGEYRWIVDGRELGAAAAGPKKRGAARRVAGKRSKRFAIELQAKPAGPAAKRRMKRNWFTEKVTDKVVAYVFRFAVKLAGKPLVKFLERNVSTGLISIGSVDLQGWQALGEAAPLPRALPKDRSARVLLLVHGTFSSTIGSFGALTAFKEGRDFLASALAEYDAVLGFDHRTLSVDPAENASEILQRLQSIKWPRAPELDIVAFSRGGLVARSFVEQVLPQSTWNATLGRMVFVACTNGGTQLAEPDNWHRFADHYTNFALASVRALSLIPGAQPYTAIAGQAIRGVGAFVKALASGAVTHNIVPGVAAMEPDGPFVTAINQTSAKQIAAADAKFYAITANFEASQALKNGSTPELPTKLLMRIADWGADELYGEDNDLVVHVRSMTHIDPTAGKFVKGTLDYGTNSTVYHTNYFTQPRTAQQLGTWFGLPAVAAAPVKRDVRRKRSGVAARPSPVIVDRGATLALAQITKLLDSPTQQIASKPDLDLELSKAETVKPPSPKVSHAAKSSPANKRASAKPTPARMGRNPATQPTRSIPRSVSPRASRDVQRASASVVRVPQAGAERRKRGIPKAVKREKKPPAPRALAPRGLGISEAGAAAPKAPMKRKVTAKGNVECQFLTQMDAQLLVNELAKVEVTISREQIEAAAGKAAARGKAKVKSDEKLIVEIAEHKELRVEGERRHDVAVPAPGEPVTVEFEVKGERVGEGELSIQIRQGSIPLATMWLRPKIVAARGARVPRLKQEFELQAYPAAEPPLDELRIIENLNGGAVTYTFMLDLPSVKQRRQFRSEPLDGSRDQYVVRLMNDIGDSWIRNQQGGVQQFEEDIRAIGSKMFSQLFPREMQELLWDHRDRIKSVQVFSGEPFIPWELIYLKDPKKGVATKGNKFLGELGLLRWLYDGFPPGQLRIRRKRVRYLIADYDDELKLPEAEAEAGMLEKVFGAEQVPATLKDLNSLLKKKDGFDLLHICCHGRAAGEQASQAQVYLNGVAVDGGIDGESLKATTVEETIRLAADGAEQRPVVVLNACESARPNREFNGMGGFAHAFVRARVGAFIGTHWSVGDAPAFAFVQALYEAFAKKRDKPITLSEAVIAARKAARGNDDATWLAYVVYGHPHARVIVE